MLPHNRLTAVSLRITPANEREQTLKEFLVSRSMPSLYQERP